MMDERPWLEHYDRGVPATLQPYPDCTLFDLVSATARERPDHTALIFQGARLSYAALDRASDALAAALADQGVSPGERVALLLPTSPQSIIAELGVWKAGAIAVPLNPMYSESELLHALNQTSAETALVLTPFYAKLKTLQSQTAVRRVIATNIKEYLPPHLRLLFTLFKEGPQGHRITLLGGDAWLGDWLRQYRDAPRPDRPVAPDDPALLHFTGGTTGWPKAALGTHQALVMAGQQCHAWFAPLLTDWQDVIVLLMPTFHAFGNVAIMPTAFVGHNPLALVANPRDLDDLLALIRTTRPAFLPCVPTLLVALLKHPQVQAGRVDLSSLKLCISGAAPLMAETKKRFEALTGGRVVEAYSLTEAMLGAVVSPVRGAYKPGSVGLPLPDVEVRIGDADSGQGSLAPGAVGEVALRAPQLMCGYWEDPEETAATLRDGWLYTGDLGYLDDDGYLFVVDRKKDLIKTSGFQVWPREVEEVLATHRAVAQVGVAGVPDAYQGEAVQAWVVLRPGETATVEALRDYCRERLAHYKVPKFIEFRDSLPLSSVGKVLRRQLAPSSPAVPVA